MLKALAECYRDSAKAAIALPLLYVLPFATELIQHIIEAWIGMFASLDSMRALGDHPARMGFGHIKVLSLVLLLYWVSRWHACGGRSGRPILGDAPSARLFGAVILYGLAISLLQHQGSGLLAPITVDSDVLMTIGILFLLLVTALDIYLAAWKVGAALGNERLTIPASLRVMHGNFWWSIGFSIAATLPLIVLHYGLNILAVGQDSAALWALLIVDAAIVGYLGLILATATFMIARRAADRSGVTLESDPRPSPA